MSRTETNGKRRSIFLASTISEVGSPNKTIPKTGTDDTKDKDVPRVDEAERNPAIKIKLICEMSERVKERPPRITRTTTTILPEFDQIPDETGELRYKGGQWAAKATYLLTSLFLHEAAIEACAIESRYELARTPGLTELKGMFAKIQAYKIPAVAAKSENGAKEAASTSEAN